MKKIEAYTMATKKPCETALKQRGIKPLPATLKAVRGRIRTLWNTLQKSITSKNRFREVIKVDKKTLKSTNQTKIDLSGLRTRYKNSANGNQLLLWGK